MSRLFLHFLAFLIVSLSEAPGAVIYTQISVRRNPDGSVPFDKVRVGDWMLAQTAGAQKSYEFDIDGDETVDFGLYSTEDRTDSGTTASGVYAAPYGSLQILGCPYPPPYGNPDALGIGMARGSIIGAASHLLFHPASAVQWGGTDYLTGQFNLLNKIVSIGPGETTQSGTFYVEGDGDPRYLAFRMLKEGAWHYGWLEAAGGPLGLEIYGIAWETDPSKTIIAGLIPEPSVALLSMAGLAWLLGRRNREQRS